MLSAGCPSDLSGWKLPDRDKCDMTSGSPSHKPTNTPSLLKVGPLVFCDVMWDPIPVHQVFSKPSESGGQSPRDRKNKSITRIRVFILKALVKSAFHLVHSRTDVI